MYVSTIKINFLSQAFVFLPLSVHNVHFFYDIKRYKKVSMVIQGLEVIIWPFLVWYTNML